LRKNRKNGTRRRKCEGEMDGKDERKMENTRVNYNRRISAEGKKKSAFPKVEK
jgi:hypothetical protein